MLAKKLCRLVALSRENRGHDLPVLGAGRRDAIAYPQLQPAVRAEPPVQGRGLFGEKRVVARFVNDVMEGFVLVVYPSGSCFWATASHASCA